jgi:glutathione S-transferase
VVFLLIAPAHKEDNRPTLLTISINPFMICIHHLTNSRSQRVIWLLEELGLKYNLIIHERCAKTRQAAESLYQVHPLGKAPVLIDGEINLAESGAIFDYIVATYGKETLAPAENSVEQINYYYWKNFSEASLMPYLAMTQVFSRIIKGTPFFFRPIIKLIFKKVNAEYLNKNLKSELNMIEQHLSTHQYFTGDKFTAADILMEFMLDALASRFFTQASHPHTSQYLLRIKQRPAYLRALKKGNWSEDEFNQYWRHMKNS